MAGWAQAPPAPPTTFLAAALRACALADASSLAFLRRTLLNPRFSPLELAAAAGSSVALAGGVLVASREPAVAEALSRPLELLGGELREAVPFVADHPRLSLAALAAVGTAGTMLYRRYRHGRGVGRAAAVASQVRRRCGVWWWVVGGGRWPSVLAEQLAAGGADAGAATLRGPSCGDVGGWRQAAVCGAQPPLPLAAVEPVLPPAGSAGARGEAAAHRDAGGAAQRAVQPRGHLRDGALAVRWRERAPEAGAAGPPAASAGLRVPGGFRGLLRRGGVGGSPVVFVPPFLPVLCACFACRAVCGGCCDDAWAPAVFLLSAPLGCVLGSFSGRLGRGPCAPLAGACCVSLLLLSPSRLFSHAHALTPPPSPPRLPLAPQVVLLDPVIFPGAIKVFAREVCRNDLLNFGRMHWFFPDSRLALDLSTDRTLKEARFDRWAQAGSGCSTLCLCASVGGRGQRGGRGECGALMRSS